MFNKEHIFKFSKVLASGSLYFILLIIMNFKLFRTQINETILIINPMQLTQWQTLYNYGYGYKNQYLYYSVKNVTGTNLIRKYNGTLLAASPSTGTILSFIPTQQTIPYNNFLEINTTHFLTYSNSSKVYQIFLNDGTSVLLKYTTIQISQFIYSPITNQILVLYSTGLLQIYSSISIISDTGSISFTFPNPYSSVRGFLSPNENFMALGGQLNNKIYMINLVTRQQLFVSTNLSQIHSLSWNPNSQIIYAYDSSTNKIFVKYVTSPYLQYYFNISIPNLAISTFISSMVYYAQSDRLYFYTQTTTPLNSYHLISFNFSSCNIVYEQLKPATTYGAYFYYTSTPQQKLSFSIIFNSARITTLFGQFVISGTPVYPQNISPSSYSYQNIALVEQYQNFVEYTLNSSLIQGMNQIPASRVLLKYIFSFFINFDDLWFYIYYDIEFNQVLINFFCTIQHLQTQKWQLINYKTVWQDKLGLKIQNIKQFLNNSHKNSFTDKQFLIVQQESNGYLLNTLNFYAVNIFLICIAFLGFKVFHMFLKYFNFKIKQQFKQFSLNLLLVLMILQGNVQFMAYLFGFEMKTLFRTNAVQKGLDILVLMINFFFIFGIIALYFFIKSLYKKKAIFLYQNFHNNKSAYFYLTFQWSIRNLLLGFIHIIISTSIQTFKLYLIISIQFTFLLFNLLLVRLKQKKGFIKKSKVWINIITTFIRIILIGTFLLGVKVQNVDQYVMGVMISNVILISYMVLWMLAILNEFFHKLVQYIILLQLRSKSLNSSKKKMTNIFQHEKIQSVVQLKIKKQNILIGRPKPSQFANIQLKQSNFKPQRKHESIVLVNKINHGQLIAKYKSKLRTNLKNKLKFKKNLQEQNLKVIQIVQDEGNINDQIKVDFNQ